MRNTPNADRLIEARLGEALKPIQPSRGWKRASGAPGHVRYNASQVFSHPRYPDLYLSFYDFHGEEDFEALAWLEDKIIFRDFNDYGFEDASFRLAMKMADKEGDVKGDTKPVKIKATGRRYKTIADFDGFGDAINGIDVEVAGLNKAGVAIVQDMITTWRHGGRSFYQPAMLGGEPEKSMRDAEARLLKYWQKEGI